MTSYPSPIVQMLLDFCQDLNILLCLVVAESLSLFGVFFQLGVDHLQVLLYQFVDDDFDVSYGIDVSFHVDNVRVLKGPYHMEDSINALNVA